MSGPAPVDADELAALGALLRQRGYRFTTVTPATHARVLRRAAPGQPGAPGLRDVFGWSKPFAADQIDAAILARMRGAHSWGHIVGVKSNIRTQSLP